jgi:hypothetical protein
MSDDDCPIDGTDRTPTSTTDKSSTPGTRIDVHWAPEHGTRHRVQFSLRPDEQGWLRIESEWTGYRWRQIGSETVTDIEVAVGTE